MKIISIDQSYTCCAYTIFNDGNMETFGTIRSNKDHTKFQRALYVATSLLTVYNDCHPDVLCIEGLSFGATGNVTRDLAGLLFTIINIINNEHDNLRYYLFAPTTVKKTATGSGRASKQEMIDVLPDDIKDQFIHSGYRKTTGLADLSDAFWIGTHYIRTNINT